MINFSVIFNTRGRSSILGGCLESFYSKAKYPDLVEFILKADLDDHSTIDEINRLSDKYPLLSYVSSQRPNSLNQSASSLAFLAKGRFVYGINDDIYMLTENWDEKILDKVNQFIESNKIQDDILYIKTDCNSVDRIKHHGYASCPLISKKAIEFFNLYLPPNFVGLGADAAIYKLYSGIGRVVPTTEVIVDHLYHNTLNKVINPDLTSLEMRLNTSKNISAENDFNPQEYIDKFTGGNSNG